MQFFLWLILNLLLATEVPQSNMFSHACTRSHQKWHGKLTYILSNGLLISFGSEGNRNDNSQASKTVYVITTVNKSTISHWASQIAGSE